MNGALGSADATHILWDKCPFKLKNLNSGGKEKRFSKAFEITVNHRRKILASTVGLPGRWNDKTVVRFDGFLNSIHHGKLYQDRTFQLNYIAIHRFTGILSENFILLCSYHNNSHNVIKHKVRNKCFVLRFCVHFELRVRPNHSKTAVSYFLSCASQGFSP